MVSYAAAPTRSLQALCAFVAWTILHVLLIVGYRSFLITTGRAKPNTFRPSRQESPSSLYGRICQAHANCLENLVVLATIILINHVTSEAPDMSDWAWLIVYARMAQSIIHWSSISEVAVILRFFCFAYQMVGMIWILFKTTVIA